MIAPTDRGRQAAVVVDLIMHHTQMVAELDRLIIRFAAMAPKTDSSPQLIALAKWIRDLLLPPTDSRSERAAGPPDNWHLRDR
jgi:hypothetical protein